MACFFSAQCLVALCLPALEHNASSQTNVLNGTGKTLPYLGAILLLLDLCLVRGLFADDMLEEVFCKCSWDTLHHIELQAVKDRLLLLCSYWHQQNAICLLVIE